MWYSRIRSDIWTYKESASVQGHPDAILHIISDEAHVLDSSRRSSIVRNPVILSRGPGQEQIPSRSDCDVVSIDVSNLSSHIGNDQLYKGNERYYRRENLIRNLSSEEGRSWGTRRRNSVQSCVYSLLHLRLPVQATIDSDIDSALRGDLDTQKNKEAQRWDEMHVKGQKVCRVAIPLTISAFPGPVATMEMGSPGNFGDKGIRSNCFPTKGKHMLRSIVRWIRVDITAVSSVQHNGWLSNYPSFVVQQARDLKPASCREK